MLRPLVPLVIALVSLAPAVACAVSASTQVGSAAPNGANDAGKPAQAGPGANPGTPGAADPSANPGAAATGLSAGPQACVAALAETSTSLFGGRVLIRLPKGVELVQQNPFYAQAASAQQATSCGAPVRFSAVGYFEWPAASSLTQVRDQLIELRGIALENVTWAEEGSRGRHYTAAYTVAADPKTQAPAVRGWLVLRDAPNDKFAYFAMFETDEASWDGLRAVFQDAGRHLLVKPRALQGSEKIAAPPKTEEPPPEPAKKKKKKKAAAG
jgi:hypothetical protein